MLSKNQPDNEPGISKRVLRNSETEISALRDSDEHNDIDISTTHVPLEAIDYSDQESNTKSKLEKPEMTRDTIFKHYVFTKNEVLIHTFQV